jgi:hypothetical protein
MSDGVNPSSIEERREDREPPERERPSGPASPATEEEIELADPGSTDQPAEGGREQAEDGGTPDEKGDEDFGSRPA